MTGRRRCGPAIRRRLRAGLVATLFACTPAGHAATWIEQAETDLFCTGLATDAERQSLDAPLIPRPVTAQSLQAYLRGKPRDGRHAQVRHLTMLAAVAWWADLINDQVLRSDVLVTIGMLADRHAATNPDDAAFRQAARCARAQLIGASVELGRVQDAERLADNLVRLYPQRQPALPVEDWPLLLATRELRLEPRARNGIAQLATQAVEYAAPSMQGGQALRANRLLVAGAGALVALGDHRQATDVGTRALTVFGKQYPVEAGWRVMPPLFDATEVLRGPADAATIAYLLGGDMKPPHDLRDNRAAFEALLRLARAADIREQYETAASLNAQALTRLSDLRSMERYSVPFYRHALGEVAAQRDPNLEFLARRDPAFGTRTAATYLGTVDTLVRQSQDQFVADAREQLFFQHKVDNSLHALSSLYPALPRSAAGIEDATFRLAQLRSYGRLTLATLAAELDRSRIDPQARPGVERFFSMSTQSSAFLRTVLASIQAAPGAPPPPGNTLWQAFFVLDVYNEEASRQYERFAQFVRSQAPRVADLATPKPLPAREFQRRLLPGEALVATLVTPRDLYVWAVTSEGVRLARRNITEAELTGKVRRLRAGLVPASASGATQLPPFDAAAAHELYGLVFAPVAASLKGITRIAWYGHGPLGSVPPAVLVSAPPAKPRLTTPAEFAATKFLVDQYAFSALADLSLFAWHRDRAPRAGEQRFLGVGAPMLSADELAGAPRPRSYELAGALDGKALAELPKLAESVDEMKAIAQLVGEANATLWLGPEAREERFTADALRGYRTIALATHGFLADEVQGVREPSLMLALAPAARDRYDGLLTATEIAGLQLDADLVILSACNTAGADGRPRAETFTGLTQAFFTAGARSLMVSHWPVMSGAAVQLSVGTMERSAKRGQPLDLSLQQAMQAVRKDGAANPLESHPSYWGPFVIVGDGR